MQVIEELKASEHGRSLLVNIADGLASNEVDVGKLRIYFEELEAASRSGTAAVVAAPKVAHAVHSVDGMPKYQYLRAIKTFAPGALCTFVDLLKLQYLIRAAGELYARIEEECADEVLADADPEATDAIKLASAVTDYGAAEGLRLQRSIAGQPLPQWFTTVEDIDAGGFGWCPGSPDDGVATSIRDRLALGHLTQGKHLFAFVSPPGWRPGEAARAARPLFWDAIDQPWFRHRFSPPCERGWGRALDMREPVGAVRAGASEMVAPGAAFAERFTCVYVGKIASTLQRDGVWRWVLDGRSLDRLADQVRAALATSPA